MPPSSFGLTSLWTHQMLVQFSNMIRRKGVSGYTLPLPSSQQMVQAFHPFPLRGLLEWDLNACTHFYSHGVLRDKLCNVSWKNPEAPCLVVEGELFIHIPARKYGKQPVLFCGWADRGKVLRQECSFIPHMYLLKILYRFGHQQLLPKHGYWWCCRIGHKAPHGNGLG